MAEVSYDVVCGKLVENSSVEDPHSNMVNADVAALKHEKAIFHDPEADITLRVASIRKLIFVEVNLAVVFYRIILPQHV